MAGRRSTIRTPEWGLGGIGNYFLLEGGASRGLAQPVARYRRVSNPKAERLGLTYEEYTLEILERGRHLQIEDVERIAEIDGTVATRRA